MNTKQFLLTVISSISLLACNFSFAQEAMLEEIVVTAQKREQAVTDVPISIVAFSSDALRSNNVEEPRDVAFLVSNMDIKGAGLGDANPAITIRGIGLNNFNSNNNPSVGVYVNEIFMSSPGMISLAMMDVERIEVLKGPQGTLYGRNSSGGAINILNKKPSWERDGFAIFTLGNYDKARFEGAFGSAFSDTLAGRVSVLYDSQGESWHEDVETGEDWGSSKNYGVRGQLAYQGDRLRWNLGLEVMKQDVVNPPFTFFTMFDAPTSFSPCSAAITGVPNNADCFDVLGFTDVSDDDPFTHFKARDALADTKIDSDVFGGTFRLDYDLENATLTSVTGYVSQDRFFGDDLWSQPNSMFSGGHDEEFEQFSTELRLAGDSDRMNWLAGAFFSNDTFEAFNLANSEDVFGAFFDLSPVEWTNDQDTTAWAVFGSIDWLLSARWTLTTGLRYTDESVDFRGGTSATLLGTDIVIPLTYTDDTFSDDHVTWRVAAEFRPNDDLLTYASVSTGFKSGGFFGDFTIDPRELEPFDSETVLAYELGAKQTAAGGKVQLNGAIFYYDYEDIQTVLPADFGFKLDNLEQADIWGVDVDLLAVPTDRLSLRFGVGYLDTEVSSMFPEFDGNELPNAPEWQLTGGARYEFPVSNTLNLAFQADVKYFGDTFRSANNTPLGSTDSYTVFNGRIVLLQSDGRWQVDLWGKNLFDEDYFQEAFDTFDPLGATAKLTGDPRTYGVSFQYFIF
jgi:iron complex outermembrane receptor protein